MNETSGFVQALDCLFLRAGSRACSRVFALMGPISVGGDAAKRAFTAARALDFGKTVADVTIKGVDEQKKGDGNGR